ncbi:MAG: hypothetical protein ACHQAX_09995 [Gammaproteobacteria bacterium]
MKKVVLFMLTLTFSACALAHSSRTIPEIISGSSTTYYSDGTTAETVPGIISGSSTTYYSDGTTAETVSGIISGISITTDSDCYGIST